MGPRPMGFRLPDIWDGSEQSHLSDGSLFAGSAEAQNSVPHAPMPPFSRAFAASLLRSAAAKPPSPVESFQHEIARRTGQGDRMLKISFVVWRLVRL